MDTLSIASLAPLPDSPARLGLNRVDETARDFEHMALSQMLSAMETDTDMSDSPFGGGAGERAFKPFLTEEYARGFTEHGGIGIAEAVKRTILQIQERAQNGGA